jgi:hypothetical protein
VPSFYGLEAQRAATGVLPGFDQLEAGEQTGGRLGWPAPARPTDAIDEAEYDLALLAGLRDGDPRRPTAAHATCSTRTPTSAARSAPRRRCSGAGHRRTALSIPTTSRAKRWPAIG